MKALYLCLVFISALLMCTLQVVSIATSVEEGTAIDLKNQPETWQIDVIEDNFEFSSSDEDKLKANLLGFLDQASSPPYQKRDFYFRWLAVVLVFSVVGFLRECWFRTRLRRAARS